MNFSLTASRRSAITQVTATMYSISASVLTGAERRRRLNLSCCSQAALFLYKDSPHVSTTCGLFCFSRLFLSNRYGTDFPYLYRREAHYVDRTLKDTKPADLPV